MLRNFFSLTKYVELLTNSCRYISYDLTKYSIPNLFIINFDNCRIFHFEDAFIGIYVHVSPPFESLSLHLNSNSNFLSNPLIGYFVYYYRAKFKRVLKILWRTHDMKREKKSLKIAHQDCMIGCVENRIHMMSQLHFVDSKKMEAKLTTILAITQI